MAEQRKVPFVTISSFNNNNAPPAESKKRRREDEAEISLGEDGGGGSAATGPGGGMGASPFGNVKAGDGDSAETKRVTVRLNIPLPEPSERGSAEFNYSELVQSTQVKKLPAPGPPKVLKPALDPYDPFAESGDDEEERREVEAPAKKFESKYSQGNTGKKKRKIKRKDVMQDLIDMGFVFNDTDPFINNSEAVKKLPAPGPPKVLKPALDPYDPFAESGDDEEERREVEAPAKKFESKYSQGNTGKKKRKIKRKDVMQDLIDMGFVFNDTDPFINNSEAVKKLPAPGPPKVLKPALDPYDPFAESGDDEEERREVEAPAKKFESKYSQGNTGKKKRKIKRKDVMQDLIDMGFVFNDTDPFINNSEAVKKLPAPGPPKVLKPALDPYDPFAESGDDEEERREVEAPAKKFESKYSQGNTGKKKKKIKRKDVMQDLIDMGFVFNDTDPFINNSEAVKKLPAPGPPKVLKPALDPYDPFAESGDDEEERREVEAPAKKFESKYSQGNTGKKKRKDRVQDLIDIGFGYDDTDPFIDNSEAYDELVPATLNTKLGGFYINTGTLQFRAASESEGEDFKKLKDGEECVIKKRRKKQDGSNMDEKKPRKIRKPKQGVSGLNAHRPEKKKRKKLMKDSLNLAAMLRRFPREENCKKNPGLARGQHNANSAMLNAHPKPNDNSMADLANDPAMMSLLGSANDCEILQYVMGDLDFGLLDSPQPSSPAQGENGAPGRVQGRVQGAQGGLLSPPPLPNGLPAPLNKRIEDLRVASHQFDQEGRKKFFTLDMNNILLDIELQVQEQPAAVRSSVYSHLEAFVPCNKEALLKRLKKLSLNIQDDRLRAPLLKLKLAVCSMMPEQIARYNMDCIAKVAKQQSEEGEKNGSEEEDEEKPGKRVMGPRKKFVWDEKLRMLLCNLVRVKLGCYELEGQSFLSPEDYLKAFMENEVKLLWPKGWMQARILFKESLVVHGHLTGNTAKKKMVPTPRSKPKEGGWVQRSTPPVVATPSPAAPVACRPSQSPAEPICLLDSLDEELTAPALDSISQALVLLSNAAKGLVQGDSPPSPDGPKTAPSSLHASPLLQKHKKSTINTPSSKTPLYISTSSSPSSLSRPPTVSPSLSLARSEGLGSMKVGGALAQAHRQSVLSTQRPAGTGLSKANAPGSHSQPKPRLPPNQKGFGSNNTKANSGDTLLSSPSPSFSHSLSGAQAQKQSNFITPMQATLTKSSHSSTSPIIKLTPRLPNPSTSTTYSSPSPNPRTQAASSMHQYSSKSPAGFRPPFSGPPGGPAKLAQGSYTPPGGQKTPSQITSSSANTNLTNTSSISKHSGSSPSPTIASTNQRQRPAGGTLQGAKPIKSVSTQSVSSQLPQVSSASSSLLGSEPSLPLGFGMLGGLVPVSLPFQFPSLLNLPPLGGTAGSSTGASGSSASNNSAFSLTQNLLKSLQSGSQVALPPHLQLAFSDVNQTQGGDVKRKSL